MKILIVDRDMAAREALKEMLEADGHEVAVESVRDAAMERVEKEAFNVIAVEPAPLPLSYVRQMTLPLRWNQRDDYFYLFLLGNHVDNEQIIRSGLNDQISKPFDKAQVQEKIANAARLSGFMDQLRHGEANLSDRRIFGKRAFHHLVVSALDRAYRYHEQAYLLLLRLTNYDALAEKLGVDAANKIVEDMGVYLSKLHRLSDFLGKTGNAEFALLLLRPEVDSEPQDATERFNIALRDFQEEVRLPIKPLFIIELWSLPSALVTSTIIIE